MENTDTITEATEEEIFNTERIVLNDTLTLIKLIDKELYGKIINIGEISTKLGNVFEITNYQYYLACYYANITLVSLGSSIRNKSHLSEKEFEAVRRHAFLSGQYLKTKQLDYAAQLAFNHHELPNGKGYNKNQNYPEEANLIHIADMFVGMTAPRADRVNSYYTGEEAWNKIVALYEPTTFFDTYSKKEIHSVISQYFDV
jgi:HD-GYP domain-containing protein (c-di-GMP phosphodiesterase class II)